MLSDEYSQRIVNQNKTVEVYDVRASHPKGYLLSLLGACS